MSIQRTNLNGLPTDTGVTLETVCQLLRENRGCRLVTFVKPSSWALAKKNPLYLRNLERMTLNIPTRFEVAWLCAQLTGHPAVVINFGSMLLEPLVKIIISEKGSLTLVGGKPGVDEGVADKLKSHFSELSITHSFHAYGEIEPKIAEIITHAPDIVFVDMGAPRQEAFLIALADAGYKGMAITCEGFFEEYLAEEVRYPQWVERQNLRFIWDLYKIPPSLWGQHLRDYAYFVHESGKAIGKNFRDRLSSRNPVASGD